MVKVTVELVRKKAEHHDKELAPLREIALHQEGIEKIEHIQHWCPKLQILLLQSNLIAKIENLHKLKELEYLNLAINNIEKIENLERCESLEKLDLTLNFIGDIASVESLKNNYNLKHLFLQGNPCTDYIGYREFVITTLPQLENLDGEEIKISERIRAFQIINTLLDDMNKQQNTYMEKRQEQKNRLTREIENRWKTINLDDSEENSKFWNEKSEHAPEIRNEIEKRNQLKKSVNQKGDEVIKKKERKLFAPNGRPYNINESKIDFKFNDEFSNRYILELFLYKYLETSLITTDLQPLYVRITVKDKIFQLSLPEEINIDKSTAKRSQITGHLVLNLVKLNYDQSLEPKINILPEINEEKRKRQEETKVDQRNNKRELLEIGPQINVLDFTNMSTRPKNMHTNQNKVSYLSCEKIPADEFEDDPDVPPLI